jgi:hypothetical protein
MTFALFNLNPLEIPLGLLCLGFVAVVGIVLWLVVINPSRRRGSVPLEEFEHLRADHRRALDRIAELQREIEQLREGPSAPSDERFTSQ